MKAAGKPSVRSWASTCGREVVEIDGPMPCPGCGETLVGNMLVTPIPTVAPVAAPEAMRFNVAAAPQEVNVFGNVIKGAIVHGLLTAAAATVAALAFGLQTAATAPGPPDLVGSKIWTVAVVAGLGAAAGALKHLAQAVAKKAGQ